jgi:hypothetical protein
LGICLLHTDGALAIGVNAKNILREEIGRYFELKEASIGPLKLYFGGRTREVELDNGFHAWLMGASQYVESPVKNVELQLCKSNQKLPSKADTPIQTSYRPELDITEALPPDLASYNQSLIGILQYHQEKIT